MCPFAWNCGLESPAGHAVTWAAPSGLLTTIQAARGGAAIAAVLAHAGTILAFPQHLGFVPMRGVFGAGIAGVDFFLVLSGFIIATGHGCDVGDRAALPAYAWKRATRV